MVASSVKQDPFAPGQQIVVINDVTQQQTVVVVASETRWRDFLFGTLFQRESCIHRVVAKCDVILCDFVVSFLALLILKPVYVNETCSPVCL
jgi:hypothetical protein